MGTIMPKIIITIIEDLAVIIWKSFYLFSSELMKEILPRFIRFGLFWNFISIFSGDIK